MNVLHYLSKVILVSIFICAISFTQPLNNSFENWTGGMPVDWVTNGPPSVNQVSVAYDGLSAAHLEVIEFGGFAVPPSLQSLAAANGHPVTEKHGSLQGWYQLMPLGNDGFIVTVFMRQGTNSVGGGTIALPATTSGWTQFSVPIFYPPGSQTPDNTIITISIIDTLGVGIAQIGSMGYIDYLTFTGPTDVEQISGIPQDYNLRQNYPNPFNPSTIIEYSIPEESFVELKVYDILGNEVASLVSKQQLAGSYRADFNANNKPAGLYFARITANEFTKVIKMTLLK
jgi:hypothetical protein